MKRAIIFFSLLTGIAQSQTLQDAIRRTDNERFDLAAADLRALIARDPAKGENYFYLGENYFMNDDPDSALIQYNKGIEANPTFPLNYVGVGKVLLQKDKTADAKAQFFKATSIGGGKNAEVFREIAEAWLTTGAKNADEALSMAQAAIKADPKNARGYILLGDAQLEKNPSDGSAPVKSYQTATSLNPKSPQGLIREGKLYQRGRNYPLALEFYNKATALEPNFAPAYRDIAELYFLAGQPAKSIENWKKYLQLNNSDYARYRYMSALFQNHQYPEAVTEYETLKKSGFNNLYLERLAGYSYAEMGNKTDSTAYQKGLQAIDKFFEMAGANFKYLPSDYKYRGLLLIKNGRDSAGMKELDRAISLDSASAGDIYSELARAASKDKDYAKAITYFEKKRNGNNKNLTNNDYYDLGRAYYFSGQAILNDVNAQKEALAKKKKPLTSELKAKEQEGLSYFSKADSAFKELTLLNPTWPIGYLWRGRSNAVTDPNAEKDSTKAFYEKMLTVMKPEEKTGQYKNYVVEAYEYLGYYYVTKKDDAKAREYWTQVKELDPSNEKAKSFLAPRKPAPAKGK